MLKYLLERAIRSTKNPEFRFDSAVSSSMLFQLAWRMFLDWFRGLRLLFMLRIPRYVFLGKGVSILYSNRITIGKWVVIGDYVTLSGLGREGLSIGNGCRIGSFSRVVVSTTFNNLGECIRLGDHVAIGDYSSLGGSGGLIIGANTITGQYFSVHPENHRFEDTTKPIRLQGTVRNPVRIGENCWFGAKVTVLSGVTIGDNCVIGAGSLVNKDIPANSIAVGNPAKVIRSTKN